VKRLKKDGYTAGNSCENTHLAPLGYVPLDRTVPHVAILPINRRRLWAHVIRYCNRVSGTTCYLVDTADLAGLNAKATRTHAWGEFAGVPSTKIRAVAYCYANAFELLDIHLRKQLLRLFSSDRTLIYKL
jgi:hypothetical protein